MKIDPANSSSDDRIRLRMSGYDLTATLEFIVEFRSNLIPSLADIVVHCRFNI